MYLDSFVHIGDTAVGQGVEHGVDGGSSLGVVSHLFHHAGQGVGHGLELTDQHVVDPVHSRQVLALPILPLVVVLPLLPLFPLVADVPLLPLVAVVAAAKAAEPVVVAATATPGAEPLSREEREQSKNNEELHS